MTFDLDLEHILDVGPCGDHRVQVWWRSSHVCGRSSDLRVKVYRQTDRRTDRQTDRQTDGRRMPRDCISSFQWNELKTNLDPSDLNSYRPIFNLSFVSKLLERIIDSRITEHCSVILESMILLTLISTNFSLLFSQLIGNITPPRQL